MHADAITPTEPLGAVAILPNDNGLPLNSAGSASATCVFEAGHRPQVGPAFTRVSACMVARSPEVTVTQSTSPHLLPPAALWLLPAERPIDRVGFAPTGDRQLSRHTEFLAQPSTGTSVIASCQISCGKNGTFCGTPHACSQTGFAIYPSIWSNGISRFRSGSENSASTRMIPVGEFIDGTEKRASPVQRGQTY